MRSEQIVESKVVGTIFAGDWSGRHLGNIAYRKLKWEQLELM